MNINNIYNNKLEIIYKSISRKSLEHISQDYINVLLVA